MRSRRPTTRNPTASWMRRLASFEATVGAGEDAGESAVDQQRGERFAPPGSAAGVVVNNAQDGLDHVGGVVEGVKVSAVAEVDASDDRMQKKIRTAQRQKVPFMLIAGDDDVAAGAVSFRYRDGSQKNGVPVADAVAEIVTAVRDRVQV